VVHVPEDRVCIDNDLVARHTFYVRDKTDTAGIFFKFGVIKALFGGVSVRSIHGLGSRG
jgi:hypothetical protein